MSASAREVRKTVTILFCDLVDSTGLAEGDPEAYRRVQKGFFSRMREIVERHGGTVEKFIGDEVMAVFGVPAVHEDDALRAVRAAQEMQEALPELRLRGRIGINTGEVLAGDPEHGLGLVAGEPVIVAKRLEQGAQPGEIVIGKATYPLVKHAVSAGPLERIPVKGKEEEVGRRRVDDVDREAPSLARRLDLPLVGRRDELRLLEEAFERAVEEQSCRLFTVLGAPGIGKSRLVAELATSLGERATTAVGRCLPYGEGITFWPLREILGELGDLADALGEDANTVQQLLDGLTGASNATGSSEESFWAVRRALEGSARRRPLILYLEDLHWAEPTFLDLVEYLFGWSRDAPILLVCIARPELVERRPTLIAPNSSSDALALDPLTPVETATLLELVSGGLRDDVRERIGAAAEGNPLFVEQMAAMLEEGDADPAPAIPPTIHALLGERLERLSRDERAVIERSSVIGRDFSLTALATLSPEDERSSLGQHLLSLVRKGFVRPAAHANGEDRFSFDHVLIRDAAYTAMPKELRGELHERVAEWAERTGTDELVGYHLEQAYLALSDIGPHDDHLADLALRAGDKLGTAGHRALARDDISAAVTLLERASALVKTDPERSSEVLLDLGAALHEGGNLVEAQDTLEGAASVAVAAGREDLRHRAMLELSALRGFVDPDIEADDLLSVAQDAVGVFAASGDDLGLAKAWAHVALTCWLRSRCAEMEEMLDRALVHAERADATREISWVLGSVCRAALLGPRPVEDAILRCQDARARGRGRVVVEAYADASLAVLRAMLGDFDEGRQLYASTRTLLEDVGLTTLVASMQMYAGMVELLARRYEAAEREFRRGYDALAEIGNQSYLATTAAFLAQALSRLDRLTEAEEMTQVCERAASRDDLATQVLWRGARALVFARTGRQDEAEALALEGVRLAGQTDMVTFHADALLDLAEVLRLAGRFAEAIGVLDEAVALYEQKGNIVSAGNAMQLRQRLTAGSAA